MHEGPWCGTFGVGKTDTVGINGWLSRSYASEATAPLPPPHAGCRECPPSLPADPFHSPSRLSSPLLSSHRHPAPISHYRETHLTPPTRPARAFAERSPAHTLALIAFLWYICRQRTASLVSAVYPWRIRIDLPPSAARLHA